MMCLIVIIVCSNLVLTMGLTFITRREQHRHPFEYLHGHYQLTRSSRSVNSEDETDPSLRNEIRDESKQIKQVSFSNFLKSRSPNGEDERKSRKKSKSSSKKRKSKGKKSQDGTSNEKVREQNDDDDEDEDEDEKVEEEADIDDNDDETGYEAFVVSDDEDDHEKVEASSGIDLGVLGHGNEVIKIKQRNKILPDGVHFDDTELLDTNQKTEGVNKARAATHKHKATVKMIRRSPNRDISNGLIQVSRKKTKSKRKHKYIPTPPNRAKLAQIYNSDYQEDSNNYEDNDYVPVDHDLGLTSVDKKISPVNQFMFNSKRPNTNNRSNQLSPQSNPFHHDSSSTKTSKKKSPLKMDFIDQYDDPSVLQNKKSYFDDSSFYQDNYIVVPRKDKGISMNRDIFPFQYNVEVRSRKSKNRLYNADSDSKNRKLSSSAPLTDEKFRKHEYKEDEHWHEKKWVKNGIKASQPDDKATDYQDRSSEDNDQDFGSFIVIGSGNGDNDGLDNLSKKSKKKQAKKKSKKKTMSSRFNDFPSDDDDDGHFDIPSKGFRVNKRFIEWTENDIKLD